MKLKKVLVGLLCVAMLVCMSACGKAKYAGSEYLGKWKATKAAYAGMELGVEDILGGEFSFTLNDDGKATVKVVDQEETGKWEETDKGVKFDGDEDLEFEKDDSGALTIDYSGVALTFEKE